MEARRTVLRRESSGDFNEEIEQTSGTLDSNVIESRADMYLCLISFLASGQKILV